MAMSIPTHKALEIQFPVEMISILTVVYRVAFLESVCSRHPKRLAYPKTE